MTCIADILPTEMILPPGAPGQELGEPLNNCMNYTHFPYPVSLCCGIQRHIVRDMGGVG